MTEQLISAAQNAKALLAVWESYFPEVKTTFEQWRILCDRYSLPTIEYAIKRCAKKQAAADGSMTPQQLKNYVESVCFSQSHKAQVVRQ